MLNGHLIVKKSMPLNGVVSVNGAKNAALVILSSLLLTDGVSVLDNVPCNADVRYMIRLLEQLGARTHFDYANKRLTVDTFGVCKFEVNQEIMSKMRASILVMGPLLARFGKTKVAMPGGDLIGLRPINYHLEGFKKLGVTIEKNEPFVSATQQLSTKSSYARIVLEYPSVGATENLMMFACLGAKETVIINAALEPEVFDLIDILTKMGARISILPGATLFIQGVEKLNPVTHSIIPDRLEVGTFLLAAAITGGSVTVTNARADHMDIFIEKLREMGHQVVTGIDHGSMDPGITLKATTKPRAVSIKTCPYPGFPTDLQPTMMAALCLAQGTSIIEETVYENRMLHVKELGKLGAQITLEGAKATIRGVEALYGSDVIASDIRASASLVLAGFAAFGQTKIIGLSHWQRGYDKLEEKLLMLGADIQIVCPQTNVLKAPLITPKLLA